MTLAGVGVPLISVQGVSKSFAGPDGGSVTVLDDISLDVGEGEFVALLGRSGSGKSTLLRCIAGLIAPTKGRVLFRGQVLTGTNRDTTMVFQTFALLPWLTVQQNVEIGLEARGVAPAERTERALRMIDTVGLDGYESAYPKELSGGMRQRVGFARALVVEPAAMLMDEPFSALDVLTSENLRGELLELWEGKRFPTKTIVMVTHNIEEAVLLADRLLVLGTNPGRIKADMPNPLPRPRRRRTPEFDELVDQIYRMMTQRDSAPAAQPVRPGHAGLGTRLPHATVDGLSGLAEILLARHDGAADLPDLADTLGLEVDALLPLVDALVLLGFAELRDERLTLSGGGRIFAGANIQESKEIFARASLERAPLVRTIFRALRESMDGNLPSGFFTDLMRGSVGEEEATRQLDVAVNWGRYAELYDYDAARGQIMREDRGIGATLADLPEPGRRGALHLYLGAAPGSGKTFTMLREGRVLRDRGEDVVIGFVRTHGRPRTEEAAKGLEVIPARYGEMDVDAVLARKPAVVLVDDFGSHAAAIAALRDAGIDVISTVDVRDLERAADAVSQITGQPATATVSDADLAEADDIRFVDNSPEALRARLGHGNIYPADQAEAARTGLFSTTSLAALREIGMRVVADSLSAPRTAARTARTARRPEPQDVLVAVDAADRADPLIQRGLAIARRSGAKCTILTLGTIGLVAAPDDRTTVIAGVSRDPATSITHAVRQTGARHLVLAVPAVRRLDRWRPSLVERLASQLPEVDLHVITGRSVTGRSVTGRAVTGRAAPAATDRGDQATPRERSRGKVRIYLGYAPGCGVTTAMLDEAGRRKSRGSDVVVAAVDGRDREGVAAALEGLEIVGDGSRLDTAAVLARHPDVACIDDLAAVDATGETRFAGARRIAGAGITVVATVHLSSMRHGDGVAGGGLDGGRLDEGAVLAFADEIELVDAPPSVLADRTRRGELAPAAGADAGADAEADAEAGNDAHETLTQLRERAFALVGAHADRRLAAGNAGGAERPSILACAAPEAGMEPLIRRSAALTDQLAGDLRVAVVAPAVPSAELQQLLTDYAALTEQLGGEFTVLQGSPAAALTAFARQHHVTEILLARAAGAPAGRHPVLRELAYGAGDAEVHLLPALR
jgi:NitT/TauT family transport system ATP-binding protein